MKITPILLTLSLCAFTAGAQPTASDETPPRRERPFRSEEGPRRGPPRENGTLSPRDHAPALDRYLDMLQARNPEEFESLKKLRDEDPEAFRRALRSKVFEARQRMGSPDGPRRPHPLAAEIQALEAAQSPEDRAAATEVLRTRIAEVVDQQLQMRERRIEAVRGELERLEANHQKDVERRAELIDEHLQRILDAKTPPAP